MNFPFYIARRYLFSKSKNNAINIITMIAGIGVFAGALALFIVLSGFSGLKSFSIQFTNDIDPDLKILPTKGKTILFDENRIALLTEIAEIRGYSAVIEERVLLNYNDKNTPANIKGVDSSFTRVTSTGNSLIAGQWFFQDENRVVIGADIARRLSMGLSGYGDVLQLLVPKPGKGVVTDPRKAFNSVNTSVMGIYAINEELNGKYVYTPFPLAQRLLNLEENHVSAIELRLSPKAKEKEVKNKIKEVFGEEVLVKNRIELNDELYKMLNTENLAVYLIFTLVLIIALFNVGGAIVMAILDKRDNIRTLFNIGADDRKIRRIFFLQGVLLTFVGGVIGLLIGVLIIQLQLKYGLVMITGALAYPVLLKAENIFVVFVTIMVLGIVASYVGSTRVSKVLQQPV